jgi:hypothetical protein
MSSLKLFAAAICLRPSPRTSFHHQPEAQHLKSSAIHKLGTADYPIFTLKSRHWRRHAPCPLRATNRHSALRKKWLFDHFVGERKSAWRDRKIYRFCGL